MVKKNCVEQKDFDIKITNTSEIFGVLPFKTNKKGIKKDDQCGGFFCDFQCFSNSFPGRKMSINFPNI